MTHYIVHNHLGKKVRDAVKASFEEWMREADRVCEKRYGLSIHDLPDVPYRDWYDRGVSPAAAAAKARRMAEE